MKAKIMIGGDVCPTKSNENMFKNADVVGLVGEEIYTLLKESDYIISNLEVPLVDEATPIRKCGPNLIASTDTIKGLCALNSHFYTLANNHILDQGEVGLKSTQYLLEKHGISYAGAGKNIEEAQKTHVVNVNGISIGIYCCAEHEFTIATETRPGANPFEPLDSLEHIFNLKKQCDYAIVLYHGGKEYYRYPSPYLQKACRRMVDAGANFVVCQHTHCIGCEEQWNNGKIVYGQGNFVFDGGSDEYWNSALLCMLTVSKENAKIECSIEYVPIVKKNGGIVQIATGTEKESLLEGFRSRTKEILDFDILCARYREHAEAKRDYYLYSILGKKNIVLRGINFLSKRAFVKKYIEKKFYGSYGLMLRNYIECEAHYELMLEGIKALNDE